MMPEAGPRPPVQTTGVRSIHPAIKTVWRLSAGISLLVTSGIFLLVGVALAGAFDQPRWVGLAAGGGLAVLISLPSLILVDRQWTNWTYQLREQDLVMTWGVFWQTRRCVARDRIQHIDINEGPLDRRFGLKQVVIHTAGMIGSVAAIPGLTHSEAEFLRQQLLDTRDPDA
jgi:membrane protein YdbS with pleckstrin-like domain